MNHKPQTDKGESSESESAPQTKLCVYCHEEKPLKDFLRRTGRKAGKTGRRGACKECRKQRKLARSAEPIREHGRAPAPAVPQPELPPPAQTAESAAGPHAGEPEIPQPKERARPSQHSSAKAAPRKTPGKTSPATKRPSLPVLPESTDPSVLRPTRKGIIRMRGKTDKGRRWLQETDLETAVTLVRERAAVVVNRHTIRRLYSNRAFRRYILTRDRYTCYYCGGYGDTIDHLLPRAKGGHTTPVNCVCCCSLCNQSKADRDLEEFLDSRN